MDDSLTPAEGSRIPVQGPHWHRPADVKPPADFVPLRLVLQSSGMAVELTWPDVLVGRHSDADLRLPLPDVSRRHCRFLFANACWQVIDLNSLNGVLVNGKRVPHAAVNHGDTVTIGGFTFEVDLSGKASEQATREMASNFAHFLKSWPHSGQRPADLKPPKRQAS